MVGDYEQALANGRGQARADGSGSAGPWRPVAAAPVRAPPGRRAGAAVRLLALPAADAAGLAAASIVSGASRGPRGSLLCALYIAVVLVVLAAGSQHRLRIRLRVGDQAGRIVAATAVPALALLLWLPAGQVLGLALWSSGFMFACRGLVCAALRAAHRRERLTEPVVVVGAGTFGAYVAELMQEHRELGLRPVGVLDDGPPRLDLSVPSLGRPSDLADVVRTLGSPPGHCVLLLGLP